MAIGTAPHNVVVGSGMCWKCHKKATTIMTEQKVGECGGRAIGATCFEQPTLNLVVDLL